MERWEENTEGDEERFRAQLTAPDLTRLVTELQKGVRPTEKRKRTVKYLDKHQSNWTPIKTRQEEDKLISEETWDAEGGEAHPAREATQTTVIQGFDSTAVNNPVRSRSRDEDLEAAQDHTMLKMTKATACIAEQINQGKERREEDPAGTMDPSSCWRWTCRTQTTCQPQPMKRKTQQQTDPLQRREEELTGRIQCSGPQRKHPGSNMCQED